jgi:FKBP-type peptidyl-prolyl cis-trans isomerase
MQDHLKRCFGATAIVPALALLFALALAGCGKHGASAPATPQAASPAPQSRPGSPAAAAANSPPATAAPSSSGPSAQGPAAAADSDDSDDATDEPEIPDTVNGMPAMMSEDAFLSAYRQIDGVVVLSDGLMYRVIASGKGKSPKPTDKVRVIYKGTLMDGSVFDQTPAGQTSEIDLNKAIAGWREALPLMKEGDKWEVVIPSSLAYGETGTEGIAPNSPLVFDIELVAVEKS